MNKALELAIKTEKDGIDFYLGAAEAAGDELGKKMYLSLVEDEKRHLDILKKMSCEVDVCITDFEQADPFDTLKTVFSDIASSAGAAKATDDDIAALDTALDMEKKSYELYISQATGADDKDLAAIYERLAFEEQKHYDILLKEKEYLEDTGNWYMWSEHSFPQ